MVRSINHPETSVILRSERSFLRTLHGGCQIPVGVVTRLKGATIEMEGAVFDLDGTKEVRERLAGEAERGEAIGSQLAEKILERGGREILDEIRGKFA
jgi:hydroxymethylbilane synthase